MNIPLPIQESHPFSLRISIFRQAQNTLVGPQILRSLPRGDSWLLEVVEEHIEDIEGTSERYSFNSFSPATS